MDTKRSETGKNKGYISQEDFQAELNALQKKIEESTGKEEILRYLDERMAELENH